MQVWTHKHISVTRSELLEEDRQFSLKSNRRISPDDQPEQIENRSETKERHWFFSTPVTLIIEKTDFSPH